MRANLALLAIATALWGVAGCHATTEVGPATSLTQPLLVPRVVDGDPLRPKTACAGAKPILAFIHADWCPACHAIEPAVSELRREYGDRITFLDLDVTDDEAVARSKHLAVSLGIDHPFDGSFIVTGTVSVYGRDRMELRRDLGSPDLEQFRSTLDAALAQGTVTCASAERGSVR